MSACPELVREYALGDGLRVEFALRVRIDGSPAGLAVSWYPEQPAQIDGQLLCRYREARGQFMELVSAATGGQSILVIET